MAAKTAGIATRKAASERIAVNHPTDLWSNGCFSMASRPTDLATRFSLLSAANEAAWWFDELRVPVHRYLVSLGLRPQEAEEVIQEVFLSLFEHLRKGGGRENLRGWVFRVAHNLGLRLRGRRAIWSSLDAFAAAVRDPSPDPEQRTAAAERRRRLMAVVRALPDQDRCCLLLRAEGLRYRDIAETLNISLGSVAHSLAKSLARLSRVDGE